MERLAAAVAQSAAGGAAKHAFPEAQVPETIWSKMLSRGDIRRPSRRRADGYRSCERPRPDGPRRCAVGAYGQPSRPRRNKGASLCEYGSVALAAPGTHAVEQQKPPQAPSVRARHQASSICISASAAGACSVERNVAPARSCCARYAQLHAATALVPAGSGRERPRRGRQRQLQRQRKKTEPEQLCLAVRAGTAAPCRASMI